MNWTFIYFYFKTQCRLKAALDLRRMFEMSEEEDMETGKNAVMLWVIQLGSNPKLKTTAGYYHTLAPEVSLYTLGGPRWWGGGGGTWDPVQSNDNANKCFVLSK